MYMQLNINKFQNVLLSIENNFSLSAQRDWDSEYPQIKISPEINSLCININQKIWNDLINLYEGQGSSLDIYELGHIFNTLSHEKVMWIFNRINIKSKCISFIEFDDFLCKIDENKYLEIIDCLENKPNIDELEDRIDDENGINNDNNSLCNRIFKSLFSFKIDLKLK